MQQSRQIPAGRFLVFTLFVIIVANQAFARAEEEHSVGSIDNVSALPDAPSSTDRDVAGNGLEKQSAARQKDEVLQPFLTSVPLARSERWHRFVVRSFSPSAFGGGILDAGEAQFSHDLPAYGHGFDGFEKRYAAILVGRTANNFFSIYLFPTVLHQDLNPSRLGPAASFWHRLAYAGSRTLIARDESGNSVINGTFLLSTVASNTLKNLYYPVQQRRLSATLSAIDGLLIGNMQNNLKREFLPDVQHFVWKHLPVRVKRFAPHLPFYKLWEPARFSDDFDLSEK